MDNATRQLPVVDLKIFTVGISDPVLIVDTVFYSIAISGISHTGSAIKVKLVVTADSNLIEAVETKKYRGNVGKLYV